MVGMEREQEVICALSNGDIFNDLDELLTQFSRSQHFFMSNISKTVHVTDKVTIED